MRTSTQTFTSSSMTGTRALPCFTTKPVDGNERRYSGHAPSIISNTAAVAAHHTRPRQRRACRDHRYEHLRLAAMGVITPMMLRNERSVATLARVTGWRSNYALNPSHSVVTALAQGSKRRDAGRAGYAQR